MTHWTLVEADLHSEYGIDTGDDQLMAGRSWRWLQTRIQGLLTESSSRLSRALRPTVVDQEARPPHES